MSKEPNQALWRGIRLIAGEDFLPIGQSDHTLAVGLKVFRNAAGVGRRMLVDVDRHGQIDVLTMPVTTVTLIPPVGTQVAKSEVATNETKIIHTVTTAKILYLSAISLCGKGAGNGDLSLEVRDADDNFKYHILCTNFKAGEACGMGTQFVPPLTIAAGWDIIVVSAVAGVEAHGFIHGFEVDA